MKKLLILMMICLVVVPTLSAKVITTGQVATLDIAIPDFDYFTLNQNFTISAHVSNSSAWKTNITTSCIAHGYDNYGLHLFKGQMIFEKPYDFNYFVDSNNFSKLGYVSVSIICNSSNEIGRFRATAEVTPSGRGIILKDQLLAFVLFLVMFLGIFMALINNLIKLGDKNTRIQDVVFSAGIFFAYVSFYYFSNHYISDSVLLSVLSAMLFPAGTLLLFIPFVGLFITWLEKRRVE